jgi:hypothetical protein
VNEEEKWQKDLTYYRLDRHMVTTHGITVPRGVPFRRLRLEDEHLLDHRHGVGHEEDVR